MMRKIESKIIVVLYFLATVLILNGCSSSIDRKTGNISITLLSKCYNTGTGRLAYSDVDFYTITLTNAKNEIIESVSIEGGTHTFNELLPGDYTIAIYAYKTNRDKSILIAMGKSDVTIEAGETTIAEIVLKAVTPDNPVDPEPKPEPEPVANEMFTVEEFKKYCEENGITKESEDFKVLKIPEGYTSINLCDYVEGRDKNPSILSEYPYLEAIIIPDTVESILTFSFQDCKSLRRVRVDGENLKYIGWSVFEGCENLFEVMLPDSVTDIDGYTFFGCSSLEWMDLPPNLKTLSDGLFLDCANLIEIIIPETVTKIGKGAIQDCESITEVVVPENVTTIGCAAFWGSEKLSKIVMKPVTPPTLEQLPMDGTYETATTANGVFEWCADDLKIFVPERSVQAYKQAWPEYKDMIYASDVIETPSDDFKPNLVGIEIIYNEECDVDLKYSNNEDKNELIFTVTGDYELYEWLVDDVKATDKSVNTFTLSYANLEHGRHSVTVCVQDAEGNNYSASYIFKLEVE